jgi:hypothetical protein
MTHPNYDPYGGVQPLLQPTMQGPGYTAKAAKIPQDSAAGHGSDSKADMASSPHVSLHTAHAKQRKNLGQRTTNNYATGEEKTTLNAPSKYLIHNWKNKYKNG